MNGPYSKTGLLSHTSMNEKKHENLKKFKRSWGHSSVVEHLLTWHGIYTILGFILNTHTVIIIIITTTTIIILESMEYLWWKVYIDKENIHGVHRGKDTCIEENHTSRLAFLKNVLNDMLIQIYKEMRRWGITKHCKYKTDGWPVWKSARLSQ